MTFAIYIYNRKKKGYEKWEYVEDVKTDTPEGWAKSFFIEKYTSPCRAKTYDMRIKINEISFRSFTVAFNSIDQEIVLAERL